MSHKVELLTTEFVTHDVKRFTVTRPDHFDYQPGQGVTLAIDEPGWSDKERPFTPTNLGQDRVLEFTIKCYPGHDGVTRRLHALAPGAQLILSDAFGSLTYHGPGWFIAGGAGITPMMAMLRRLAAEDRLDGHGLIFANQTPADIIAEKEFRHYLGDRCIYICDDAQGLPYNEGRIDQAFLERHVERFDQHFYTCGPPKFNKAVNEAIKALGAEPQALVFDSQEAIRTATGSPDGGEAGIREVRPAGARPGFRWRSIRATRRIRARQPGTMHVDTRHP